MKIKLAGIGKALLIPFFAIALAGGGAAIVGASGTNSTDDPVTVTSSSPSVEPTGSEEAEAKDANEDSVERFHGDDATKCDAPEGTTLEGNWTHGDFVSAWAESGDHDKTLAAAQSRCGKPMSAHVKDDSDAEEHGSQASEHRKNNSEVHGKSAEHRPAHDESDDDESDDD